MKIQYPNPISWHATIEIVKRNKFNKRMNEWANLRKEEEKKGRSL